MKRNNHWEALRCRRRMPAKRVLVAAAVGVGASFALGARGGGSSEAPVLTYTLSGTVSGLTSAGLVLSVNGSSNVSVASGASTISLASSLASGSSYAVAVQTQPNGETCAVAGGTGIGIDRRTRSGNHGIEQ